MASSVRSTRPVGLVDLHRQPPRFVLAHGVPNHLCPESTVTGHASHSAAQRLLASDVNATVIPRPYRHHASSGSPDSVARMNSLVGFGLVTTYPSKNGALDQSISASARVGRMTWA